MPPRAHGVGAEVEAFAEKDFYLEEFRGRSVLIAVDPACVAERPDLGPLSAAVADLVRNDTRVLLWWPTAVPGAERRLRGALARAVGRRRRGARRTAVPRMRLDEDALASVEVLSAELWNAIRRDRVCVLVVDGRSA